VSVELPAPLQTVCRVAGVSRSAAHEQRRRQADDVEVVALDPLDESRAPALDRVAACAALPLGARHVPGDVARRQLAEGDERHLAVHLLPRRREQRQAGDDLVRAAREALEHLLRGFGALRLAVDAAGADDLGVAAEHRAAVRPGQRRARLAERVRDRILLRLLVVRRHDVERDAELLEDLPPARRGRG